MFSRWCVYCGYVLVNHATLTTVCVNVLLVVGVVSMLMNLEKYKIIGLLVYVHVAY